MFTKGFTGTVYVGETITCEVDGFTCTATIHQDDTNTPPWENDCGHGPVSDWIRDHPDDHPEWRVLSRDRSSARYYKWDEAVEQAMRDSWGCSDRLEGESDLAYRMRAVEQDYKFLRGWCDDEWTYVGVDVTIEREGVTLVDEFAHALWGIESCSPEHCTDTANELLSEALDEARKAIRKLTQAA